MIKKIIKSQNCELVRCEVIPFLSLVLSALYDATSHQRPTQSRRLPAQSKRKRSVALATWDWKLGKGGRGEGWSSHDVPLHVLEISTYMNIRESILLPSSV